MLYAYNMSAILEDFFLSSVPEYLPIVYEAIVEVSQIILKPRPFCLREGFIQHLRGITKGCFHLSPLTLLRKH